MSYYYYGEFLLNAHTDFHTMKKVPFFIGRPSYTGVTALCPCARHTNPSLIFVQPRKTHPYITEKFADGT